jgi:NADPH2:quinone reductase
LITRAQLRLGESILIHGGAGGVGSIAIQLAHAIGARVFATARSRDREFLLGLGADAVIDYATEDYEREIARLTDSAGVDVVLDCVGGNTLTRSPHVLASMGRVVSLVDTAQPQDLLAAWGRNLTYHFVFTRQHRGKLDQLTRLIDQGHIRPVIGAVLPFDDIPRAHGLVDAGIGNSGIKGKVVIDLSVRP